MSSSKNLFLIGFMGSGKSTLGKHLAKSLKMDFVDLDNYIENQEARTIDEIFKENGEPHFRKLENKYLKKIIRNESQVIALGGGTPCFENNARLIDFDQAIYLMVSIEDLTIRLLKERNLRPLISEFSNKKELSNFIRAKLKERKSSYMKARIRVRNNRSLKKTIRTILKCL